MPPNHKGKRCFIIVFFGLKQLSRLATKYPAALLSSVAKFAAAAFSASGPGTDINAMVPKTPVTGTSSAALQTQNQQQMLAASQNRMQGNSAKMPTLPGMGTAAQGPINTKGPLSTGPGPVALDGNHASNAIKFRQTTGF